MSSQSLGSSLKISEASPNLQSTTFRSSQDADEKLVLNINWIRLPVSDPCGESFLVKFKIIPDGFVLFVSNMKCVWKKRYEKEEIESDSNKYCKGLNMSAESLVQQIEQFLIHHDLDSIQERNQPKIEIRGEENTEEELDMLMDSIQSVHASALKRKRSRLVITIRALLPTQVQISLPFYWEIHCDSIDPSISMSGDGLNQDEVDHSYILIQDDEENPKKRKQSQEDNDHKHDLDNVRFYNKENLFIHNHVIKPLLGIVQTQNQQIDQLKSLLLKKEQELINFRQMYSGVNSSTQTSDILDQLDKILLVGDSLTMCDISFTISKTDSSDSSNKNPLLQQLYSKYMNHLFCPPKSSKKQKIVDTREPSQHSFGGGINSQGAIADLGGDDTDLIPEEIHQDSQTIANIIDSQPSNVVELSNSVPTTSQRSEYIETEEEKQRRMELDEKLIEKRKKKMANEQKKKIKNAFM